MFMIVQNLKPIVESLLFASESPINAGDLLKIINQVKNEEVETEIPQEVSLSSEENPLSPEDQLAQVQQSEEKKLSRAQVQQVIDELVTEYENNSDRGFRLVNVAQGFQFRTSLDMAPYIKAMNKVAPTRLSQAAMEVLSIVAYRQPMIRAEIDQIRGVDSGGVLKTLIDRDLIRVVGKKDEAGKPILYGTTEIFLEVFNLRSLQDLPSLKDLAQMEDEMKRASAEAADTIEVEEGLLQETLEASTPVRSFEELEREEEEAFAELDKEILGLKQAEEKVVQIINPVIVESSPLSSSSSPASKEEAPRNG